MLELSDDAWMNEWVNKLNVNTMNGRNKNKSCMR